MASEQYPMVPLGEMVHIFDHMRIPVKKADRRTGPFPYYGASGIVDYVDSYIFDGEYLLLTEDGENLRSQNTPIAFMATGKFWVNNHAHILRGNSSSVTRFLCYALQVADVRSQLSGSTRPKLTQRDMTRIPIHCPPVTAQRAIAHILWTLDDKIELNRRLNETLEGIARALFKSWFVDFDPVRAKSAGEQPAGLAPHLADLFPDAFEESELGESPRGWTRTNLKRLFPLDSNCVITGPFGSNLHASDYRDEGVPLLLVKNVMNGAIVEEGVPLVGWHKASELERYRLKLGDVIFTRVGAVGRSAYIHPRHVGWMISGQTLRVSISDWSILLRAGLFGQWKAGLFRGV